MVLTFVTSLSTKKNKCKIKYKWWWICDFYVINISGQIYNQRNIKYQIYYYYCHYNEQWSYWRWNLSTYRQRCLNTIVKFVSPRFCCIISKAISYQSRVNLISNTYLWPTVSYLRSFPLFRTKALSCCFPRFSTSILISISYVIELQNHRFYSLNNHFHIHTSEVINSSKFHAVPMKWAQLKYYFGGRA